MVQWSSDIPSERIGNAYRQFLRQARAVFGDAPEVTLRIDARPAGVERINANAGLLFATGIFIFDYENVIVRGGHPSVVNSVVFMLASQYQAMGRAAALEAFRSLKELDKTAPPRVLGLLGYAMMLYSHSVVLEGKAGRKNAEGRKDE